MAKAIRRTLTFIMVLLFPALWLLPGAAKAAAPSGIAGFYSQAEALTQAPPPETELTILHQCKVEEWQVTLIGLKGSPKGNAVPIIAALSRQPLVSLPDQLSLRLRFHAAPRSGKGLEPAEWLYVYDRNKDGKFDYMCFPIGPLAVKPPDFPADFPKDGPDKSLKYSSKEINLLMSSMRFVFYHLADDDFDGALDTWVLPVMDPDRRAWVEKRALVRCAAGGETADTAWYFKENIAVPLGAPERTAKGFRLLGWNGEKEIGKDSFANWNMILSLFNQAYAQYLAAGTAKMQ